MPAFIFEIGSEEIPARFLDAAELELADKIGTELAKSGVAYSGLRHFSTPRRLAVFIEEIASTSQVKEEVVVGPPVKAAYDVGGRPTRAAEGFAKTHGIALDDAFIQKTDKGDYLAVRKTVGGEKTLDILARICPDAVSGLSFPKRMHWGSGTFTFARPLRWLLAMLDGIVIPFSAGQLHSGNMTFGHRVHGPGPFPLQHAREYMTTLAEQGRVVANKEDRRSVIVSKGDELAAGKKGKILWKESLLDEVEGLCEYPVPLLGAFDPSFLEIPREVLLTSMESHQKSFGLENTDGQLLPYFLTVLNVHPQDTALVQKGWERVLRARLEDARFFWKTDTATPFEIWLKKLDSVVFLAPLGSMGDKSRRVSALCGWLAEQTSSADAASFVSKTDAERAGRLCKADLVSEMVKEFDTLQGIMGGIYASLAGEHDVVAAAIAEQYLPAGPDSPVPASQCGALLAIADKADTLAGCFGLGMTPTGTADPYGLRRAVLGIARIILEKGIHLDLRALFIKAYEAYGDLSWKQPVDQSLARLEEFCTQRLKHYCVGMGHETLIAEACLLAGANDVLSAIKRMEALSAHSKTPDFEPAVLTFKRLDNIIKKQEEAALTGKYDENLFEDQAEKDLGVACRRLEQEFDALWQAEDYAALIALILQIRPAVDTFFDTVMVMCEDEALRNNRLNLLFAVVSRLSKLADFSALQI